MTAWISCSPGMVWMSEPSASLLQPRSPAHGPAVPFAEVIQYHRLMTSGREDLRRVAANVARPARDEDPHAGTVLEALRAPTPSAAIPAPGGPEDIRPPLLRIIRGQGLEDDGGGTIGEFADEPEQAEDRVLLRVPRFMGPLEVDSARRTRPRTRSSTY